MILQQQGVSLTTLVNQIMSSCSEHSQQNTLDKLNQLLNKKNLEPKKIGEHIYNYFHTISANWRITFDHLMELMRSLLKIHGREQFKLHFFSGFQKYFLKIKFDEENREEAYSQLEQVDHGIIGAYLELFVDHNIRDKHKQQILNKVDLHIQAKQLQNFKCALRILSSLGLKKQRQIELIVRQIKRHLSDRFKFGQIIFYFKKEDINQIELVIEQLSFMKKKEADRVVLDVIEKFKLNYQDYPQIVFNIERRGINYNYRQYPLYFCEAKFLQNPRYLAHIALILFEEDKYVIAKSLIEKHNLHDIDILEDVYEKMEKYGSITLKNVLIERDDFGATELRVLQTSNQDYLELIDFGIQQDAVIWVDNNSNHLETAIDTILKSKYLGFDAETSGGIHSLQKNINQIFQIATETQIFIFDIPTLSTNHKFIDLLHAVFYQNEQQVVIGHGCVGDLKVISSLTKSHKKIKKIEDTQKIFKEEMKALISLKDIVKKRYDKAFSKFEQCSGWANRPLRRAQLHYAALDAFVLVKIFKNQDLVIKNIAYGE